MHSTDPFLFNSCRISDFRLEIEQQVMLSLFEFFKNVSSNLKGEVSQFSDAMLHPSANDPAHDYFSSRTKPLHFSEYPFSHGLDRGSTLLPSVVPFGAPWQKVYLLARQQKKVYVELFDLAPIKLTVRYRHHTEHYFVFCFPLLSILTKVHLGLSFSTIPWVLKNPILTSGELLMHVSTFVLFQCCYCQITHQPPSINPLKLMGHGKFNYVNTLTLLSLGSLVMMLC